MHILSLVAAAALAACANAPSQADCERLHAKVVELEFAATPARSPDRVAALADASRSEFVARCVESLPKKRLDCALRAATKADLVACDQIEP
ncbi:MAG: hypothetical protein D6689_09695 [Deltaproteobacteria bacterium]|nr:MAG: hypothetical protein D6689_09695 [Deltaproteobacteria bacterium]